MHNKPLYSPFIAGESEKVRGLEAREEILGDMTVMNTEEVMPYYWFFPSDVIKMKDRFIDGTYRPSTLVTSRHIHKAD